MKTIITTLLALALTFAPVQETKGSVTMGVCLIIGAVVIIGGVSVTVKSCAPKWYHLKCGDSETCIPTTLRQIAINECSIICGSYASRQKLLQATCPAGGQHLIGISSLVNGSGQTSNYEQPVTLHLEKSTNLVDWVEVAVEVVNPESFEFSFINPASETACYYRAWF